MAVLPGAVLSVPRVSVEAAKTRANERPRGGGILAEKLGRGVRSASQNPYPIYDQNLRFPLPYL